MTATRAWHAQWAWLGGEGAAADVLIEIESGRISAVTPGEPATHGAVRLPGLTLPGLRNTHSHVFHRALRGRTQSGAGDFWAWRDAMYEVALALTPDTFFQLARATFAEMVTAGITHVEEFHYLHHPDGMDDAVVSAAAEAGIGLTLVDACYLRAGFGGEPLAPAQERFTDGSVSSWAARSAALAQRYPDLPIASAIHSVRAVRPDDITAVVTHGAGRDLHVHLSEQPAENVACVETTGRTPTALLHDCGALGARTTVVHATHVTDDDVATLGRAGVRASICPTTERDLADGIGPVAALVAAGCRLALGSDSHAAIDLFEEARAVELDQRLASGRRGTFAPARLLAAATGVDRIEPGGPGDLVTVSINSPRTAGFRPDRAAAAAVFAGSAADVTDVVVSGRPVVRAGRHDTIDVGAELAASIAEVTS